MANKELPIGIDGFRKIREGGYYYVDKTDFVSRLAMKEGHYFLSRPRRFGKSLLVDTLQELFEGSKELFEGLYIHDKWDWAVKYPVVRLDFGGGGITTPDALNENVMTQLEKIEKREGVSNNGSTGPVRLLQLISALAENSGKRVVVLVDEYEKPINNALDTIGKEDVARANRSYLSDLYGTIKQCNKDIHFTFLTGVSKFAHAGIFSGLNNLTDITLEPEFSSICGYTDHEIDTVFAPEIGELDREEIKEWYNGYNWCGDEKVYNPFSILQLFRKREFDAWWYETGTPSFLIKTLGQHSRGFADLEGIVVGRKFMSSFDIGSIDPAPLLFQSGYLTITEKTSTPRGPSYKLESPNREVRMSLHGDLLQHLAPVSVAEHEKRLFDLARCVDAGDFAGIKVLLQSLFQMLPYHWYINGEIERYEAHFASVICGAFYGAGLDVRPEEHASGGRVDMAVVTPDHVVLFEFKVLKGDVSPGDAMNQLRERNYAARYRGLGRPIYLVGVEFSPERRNIEHFNFEQA